MFKIYAIIGIIVLVLGGIGFGIIKYQDSKIDKLNQEIAASRVALEVQTKTIENLQSDFKAQTEAQKALFDSFQEIESRTGALEKTFDKHDLDNLAKRKPKLIEKRVNNATADVLDRLEGLSQ